MERYPEETLPPDEDDGTMPDNVDTLRKAVIGHKIVSAGWGKAKVQPYHWTDKRFERTAFIITLDNGTRVALADSQDCCAYTWLKDFLLHPDKVDHVILGVGTTDKYTRWHIYADLGDVLELTVDWDAGNPFYYGYGFHIDVLPIEED